MTPHSPPREHPYEREHQPDDARGPRIGLALPLACAGALALCCAWAAWPVNPPALPDTSIAVAERAAPAAPPPLDVAAFRVPLWVIEPPPSEPAPAPPPPPPPPLRLQLLAIVRQGETLKASVYDPDSDTLVLVGPGDAIGGCTVEEVAATSVVLRRGEVRHTLALEQARGGAQ